MSISPIRDIIAELRQGRMVILVDEEDRENEGDLVMAAEAVTAEAINFMITHARGLVCLTLTEERCAQLALPLMARDNKSAHNTAFTVSIEAAQGVTTGISAHDRAHTIRVAVAANAKAADVVQPGHVFPVMARPGGVLARAGHTEAGCDLAQIAGFQPAAVICEIINPDGSMARLPDLDQFAAIHQLKIGAIRDLIHYRSETETLIECVADKPLTTAHGAFRLRAFADKTSCEVHLALSLGDIDAKQPTLVRVQEPLTVLDFLAGGYRPSGHRFSIERALAEIARVGCGVLVLMQQPSSGKDLLAAIHALPPEGSASLAHKWDPRSHGIGAQILRAVGVGKMRLMGNPVKLPSMAGFDLEVSGYVSPDELMPSEPGCQT